METVKKVSGCQGLERRGTNRSSEVLQGSESLVYDTIMVATYHYTFVQTHRVYNTKSELQCKLWTLSDNDVSV